ncbi:MAG: hypothetical protein U9N02_03460 [Campylobacterota bacterium]|nr:hypothetical protein [Campylobacterota bacterium]
MGIPLKSLEEKCCEFLNSLDTLNLDEYKKDKTMSSIDNILECKDKYLFIEEKSFLLDYFRLAGKRCKYEFIPKDAEISDEFLEKISTLDIEIKQQLFYKAMYEKTLTSDEKVKDTTFILCNDDNFCNEKIKKSKTIYLYCKTGTHADKIANIIFNSNSKKNKIVECNRLEKYIQINCK